MADKQNTLRNYLSELPDFVFRFIDYYYDGESVNTQLAFALDIKIFLNFLIVTKKFPYDSLEEFSENDMEQISVDDLLEYKSYLKQYTLTYTDADGQPYSRTHRNSSFGINRKMSSLRSLFSYLYKTDKISQNITLKVDMNKLVQKIKKPLTLQETMRLMDVILNGEKYFKGRLLTEYLNRKKRDVALYLTYLGTGVRVSECVGLDIEDVDFKNNGIKVTRKGGNEMVVYFGPEVEKALKNYLEVRKNIIPVEGHEHALFYSTQRKRIGVQAVENLVKKYARQVTTTKKITPHKLRSTYGTALYQETGDIYLVADVLGHKDVNTTKKHYAALDDSRRRQAATAVKLRED